MTEAIDRLARHRAGGVCEYCHLPEAGPWLAHPVDHVIARQHGGASDLDNAALCCVRCNASKGPNLSGLDPLTGRHTRLFHPRTDRWSDHFAYVGPVLNGLTPVGRTTVVVLGINQRRRVLVRAALLDDGVAF